MRSIRVTALVLALGACKASDTIAVKLPTTSSIKLNPCSTTGTLSLAAAQTVRVDCSNGGTTLTLAGNGASYLVVPQFATDQGANSHVNYILYEGSGVAAGAANRLPSTRFSPGFGAGFGVGAILPGMRPLRAQREAERVLRSRMRARSAGLRALFSQQPGGARRAAVLPPPAAGSIKAFHVASSFTVNQWKTVGAKLAYVGNNLLLYIDTLAPANGFTAAQLTSYGQLFDQTLYPLDTTAFGSPSDIDNNGRVIMLMSPVVNADTPVATCASQGYVAGFFDTADFDGPLDPNSNQAEIFYSIVPDPTGVFSCSHSVADLGGSVPATFMHELQHLINYSQHVVVSGGAPGDSWMDEGLSIIAEELGSLYYEAKCPPPSCRANAAQFFPDSAQGFVEGFLYDSYQYALLPDTASLTLNTDDLNGFSWRGGDWLLMRWLGDQFGSTIFRKLERGPSNGVTNIQQATGQSFPSLFANFGLALYTDSLPGLARSTALPVNRFATRNVKALWARLYATSGPAIDVPIPNPVQLSAITSDSSSSVMTPGTMTYFRLDTPATSATVTIRFAPPGGGAFAASLRPQMAVFRLPTGQ